MVQWWLKRKQLKYKIQSYKGKNGVKVLGGLNKAKITKGEVKEAIKEIKVGKAAGLDGYYSPSSGGSCAGLMMTHITHPHSLAQVGQ